MLTGSIHALTLLGGAAFLVSVRAEKFDIVTSHAGADFFKGWTFATGYDNTTNGDTTWSSEKNVAYVNDAGQAILKIDNTTEVPYNEKRDSVKLFSQDWYKPGTVFVMDATHVPVGCSVWPAWWTQGVDWPKGGEIDIYEPVNRDTTNQIALHTVAGCTATPDSSLNPTGQVGSTNCDKDANSNSGCTVSGGPAGETFNSAQGGAYVMSFQESGITVWYLERSAIPSSMTADAKSIDTESLGNPIASYSSSSCDMNKIFSSQQMVLDITMCGDYAGTPSILQQTCPALQGDMTCYTTYVLNSTTYSEAYFQINYLNVYGSSDSVDTALSNNAGGASSSTGGSNSPTGASSTGGSQSTGKESSADDPGSAIKGAKIGIDAGLPGVVAIGMTLVGLTIGGTLLL